MRRVIGELGNARIEVSRPPLTWLAGQAVATGAIHLETLQTRDENFIRRAEWIR
jgi:hypothetical protein